MEHPSDPALAASDQSSTRKTVNLEQLAKLVCLVRNAGVGILIKTGTFGEGASLPAEEVHDLVDCILQTTQRAAPPASRSRSSRSRALSPKVERRNGATAPRFPDRDLAKFMSYSVQVGRALPRRRADRSRSSQTILHARSARIYRQRF
jgi:hypothetical protein